MAKRKRKKRPTKSTQASLREYVEAEMAKHPDWSESYARGWCQVKYRKELRDE